MSRLAFIAFLIGISPMIHSARSAEPKGSKYALIVGVSKYDPSQLVDLPSAENDATNLAEALITNCGFPAKNVYQMTLSEVIARKSLRYAPTAPKIRRTLSNLFKVCTSNDTLVVAFTGHGVQFKGENEIFYCPDDADLGDRTSMIGLQREVLHPLERECEARVKLLLVDASRDDPRSKTARGPRKIDLQKLNQSESMRAARGVSVFFSCSTGEAGFTHRDSSQGVFFHFLTEGLKGAAADEDGMVTLSGLKLYVWKAVQKYVAKEFKEKQVPDLRESTQGIVVLAHPKKEPPKPRKKSK